MDYNKIYIITSIILIIYLIIKIKKIENNINKETFAITDQISQTIKEVYNTDMESIRKLSDMAISLQNGGLTIPGNLTVTGNLNTKGNLTSTNINLSGTLTAPNINLSGTLTAPNITANTNLTANSIFNYLPNGTIVAFNSTIPPAGWVLCDGNNGTPDLRGKFIRMWNDNMTGFDGNGAKLFTTDVKSTYNEAWHGTARGNKNGYVLKHKFGSYAGTDLYHQDWNEMPVHSHGYAYSGRWGGGNRQDHNGGSYGWNGDWTSTGNAGSGYGATNQPPYYVLTWIMKL